jgi:hypothetical protein
MVTTHYTATQIAEYIFAILLVLLFLNRFGREISNWVLKVLYDIFIQHHMKF